MPRPRVYGRGATQRSLAMRYRMRNIRMNLEANSNGDGQSDSELEVEAEDENPQATESWWRNLRNPKNIRLKWNRECDHCNAKLLTGENSSFCCAKGTKLLERLPELPQGIDRVYSSSEFSHQSRKFNSAFSFTALGVDGEFIQLPACSSIVLQGRTYHRMLPANHPTSPLRWFLFDSNETDANQRGVSQSILRAIKVDLEQVNPFINHIRSLSEDANQDASLHLRGDVATGEIAALICIQNTTVVEPRTVVVWYNSENQPTFIDTLDPLYEPLQYPLLFPHGTLGWGLGSELSQIWHCRSMLVREERFLRAGRLTNEYLVDMFSRVEEERLNYIKFHQPTEDEFIEAGGERIGGNIYLPTSFLGSKRWCKEQTADGLALVSKYGKPSFFITVTTNPNWPEIKDCLKPGQNYADIPTIVCRAFHERLKRVKKFIREKFGSMVYMIHVVEFQKRGLPHAHLAVKVHPEPKTPEEIYEFICAELPKKPGKLRDIVLNNMTHNHGSRCRNPSGGCSYQYPKILQSQTTIDSKGFVHYRRREEEDALIVPYNPQLLILMESHVNVEISHTVNLIMYLYKYLFKGPDFVNFALRNNQNPNEPIDEIKDYVKGRYLSAMEACWRIFAYHITEKNPSVECLPVHCPGRVQRFSHSASLSLLERYFLRPRCLPFENMKYIEYYEKCTFTSYNGETPDGAFLENEVVGCARRIVKLRQRGEKVARLKMYYPTSGDVYYLRLLLYNKSATSFEDMRTINGPTFSNFQEAAVFMGLVENENEGHLCMEEAIESNHSPAQLRFLFSQLILDGKPALPLWDAFQIQMSADFLQNLNNNDFAINRCLEDISRFVEERGRRMTDFGLAEPEIRTPEVELELLRWISRKDALTKEAENMAISFNSEQRGIVEMVLSHVFDKQPLTLFINGKVGRGKTFLIRYLCTKLRSMEKIVLPAGSTALAASNYEGGMAAHSLFRIPVEDNNEMLTSLIESNSDRADLLRQCSLFIWDELPMINKAVLQATDNLMRTITRVNKPFGGKVFIGIGDFRQVAPVVRNGGKTEIVNASVKTLPLWKDFQISNLNIPIRNAEDPQWSNFIDDIGEGQEREEVSLDMLQKGTLEDMIEFVFPSEILKDPEASGQRCILSPLNKEVDEINTLILGKLDGQLESLKSCDTVKEQEESIQDSEFASVEFLNSLNQSGVPVHELLLKVGTICRLLKNMSMENGLCKNTRVSIENIGRLFIEVKKVGGSDSRTYLIPRVDFYFKLPWSTNSWTVHRKQFPLRLAYANTINSAQGLTCDRVGFYLKTHCFSHGQLYTALGRIRKRSDGFLCNETDNFNTTNVVYKELLL